MNTPAHAVFNLLFLGRRTRPHLVLPITIGSILPDAPIFLFYFWEKHLMGRPERWIWSTGYHDPSWQALFDLFNSIPLLGIAALLSFWRGRSRLLAMFGSMILHCLADLPLHHHDAHRHFFPFSEWRFESPVSYWDPRHYGHIFAPLELLLVLAGSLVLITTWKVRSVRLIGGTILLLYVLFWVLGSGFEMALAALAPFRVLSSGFRDLESGRGLRAATARHDVQEPRSRR